jgi:LacI family transcriptional regulator
VSASSELVERRERPTMKDVAALAGVSIKTVSRVISDVPTVDPDMAARVRDAAAKLGYRPNLTASNLRRADGRTNTIGLLLEDVSNPFSSALHRAVEDFFHDRGVLVLAGSLDEDPDRERELARSLINRRVDGLIIMPAARDHRWVVAEQQAGTSVVFIDRRPVPLIADAIVIDNRASARTAVEHLLKTGRRRIAYLGDDLSIPTAHQRFNGFEDAMAAAALEIEEPLVRHGLRTAEQAKAAAKDLLARPDCPEGIFTSQNLVTIGTLEALHEAGLQHGVAIVGFDDLPLAAALQPGVTVMAQDPATIGRLAAQRLVDRMSGDSSAPTVHTVATRLIVRGSGELPLSPTPRPPTHPARSGRSKA